MHIDAADLRIAPVTDEDYGAFARTVALAFGETLDDDAVAHYRRTTDLNRTLAARDGDLIVGTTLDVAFSMSVPHAAPVACAGVTAVGVRPTHRRRGVLRALMRHQLDDIHERGESWAALYASESGIYGRFGYGVASRAVDVTIDRVWAQLQPPPPPATVELVAADEGAARVPGIYAAVHATRPGMMDMSADDWREELTWDPPSDRDGAGPRTFAIIGDRAYALYRLTRGWNATGPSSTLSVQAAVAVDAEAERALWSYLFGIDLVGTVTARLRPVDDGLPWWLAHRQRLRVTESMPCYVRLVDVGAALSSRGTRGDGAVVVDVLDGFCPWNARRWRIEGDGAALRCEETRDDPDLRMDVRELGSLSLGGVAASQLHRAGLIEQRVAGSTARLDALLASDRPPWNPFVF